VLVTANDYTLDLYNGDTGVIIADPADGAIRAAFARGNETLLLPPARLDAVETLHAMTIHRGQGSQFDEVTVILPPADSPLLTRELLYTAVTRARERIRVVGTPEAVRAGVLRRVRRASGLRQG
jgi:exodeoxyribonuclease V alpha subunit